MKYRTETRYEYIFLVDDREDCYIYYNKVAKLTTGIEFFGALVLKNKTLYIMAGISDAYIENLIRTVSSSRYGIEPVVVKLSNDETMKLIPKMVAAKTSVEYGDVKL